MITGRGDDAVRAISASQPAIPVAGEAVRAKRDPIKETVAGLASLGRSGVSVALIAGAWRDILYPELQERVGQRLSIGLSDTQLREFEALVDNGAQEAAAHWLSTHVSDYPEIVAEESDRLICEAVDWFAHQTAPPVEEIK